MTVCTISEAQLFSWVDRDADELQAHIADCPHCRAKSQEIKSLLSEVAHVTAEPLPQYPSRVGEYEILRLIGGGGQGWVFEAEQQSPRRRVALKVVKTGSQSEDLDARRLEREAQTLAHLKHPGIAAIYDAGRTPDGRQFFAMELVAGEPLNQYVQRAGLTLEERLELFLRVCAALEYAHQRGVIHRDLKPSNILIEADQQPKIVDFGLARSTHVDVSHSTTLIDAGKIVGTLPYMSPEQARADALDLRADVYSMGVILFELLTDRLPFQLNHLQPHAALRVVCEQGAPNPGSLSRRIAPELDIITLKALEKDREQRYQRIDDLAGDISRFTSGKPILARRPTLFYRARKLIARNKLASVLVATICILSMSSAIWISVLNAQARSLLNTIASPITARDIENLRRQWQASDPGSAVTSVNAAEMLRSLREFDDPETTCRRALETLQRTVPLSPDVLYARLVLGRILTDKGKAGEAQAMLRETVREYARRFPEREQDLAMARFALSRCLMRLGIQAEAETLLLQSHAALGGAGATNARALEVLDGMVEYYELNQMPDKARVYRDARQRLAARKTP